MRPVQTEPRRFSRVEGPSAGTGAAETVKPRRLSSPANSLEPSAKASALRRKSHGCVATPAAESFNFSRACALFLLESLSATSLVRPGFSFISVLRPFSPSTFHRGIGSPCGSKRCSSSRVAAPRGMQPVRTRCQGARARRPRWSRPGQAEGETHDAHAD